MAVAGDHFDQADIGQRLKMITGDRHTEALESPRTREPRLSSFQGSRLDKGEQ